MRKMLVDLCLKLPHNAPPPIDDGIVRTREGVQVCCEG